MQISYTTPANATPKNADSPQTGENLQVQATSTLTNTDLDEIAAAVGMLQGALVPKQAGDDLEPALWQITAETESLRQKLIAWDANANSAEVDTFLASFDEAMAALVRESEPEVTAGVASMSAALAMPAEPAAAKLLALQQAYAATADLREQIFGLNPAQCPPAMVDFMLASQACADALVETTLAVGIQRMNDARAMPDSPLEDKLMAMQQVLTDHRALYDLILAGEAGGPPARTLEFAEVFHATEVALVDAADRARGQAREEFEAFLDKLNATPEPQRSDAQRAMMRLLVQIQAESAKTALLMSFMEAELQIADLKAAAAKTETAAETKFTGAMVQASMSMAAGAAQMGFAGSSVSNRVAGAKSGAAANDGKHAGDFRYENQMNIKAARQSGAADIQHAKGQAASGSLNAFGSMFSAGFEMQAAGENADAQKLQASATARDVNRQAWLDLQRNGSEGAKSAVSTLQATGSSEAQTTSAIARNMA